MKAFALSNVNGCTELCIVRVKVAVAAGIARFWGGSRLLIYMTALVAEARRPIDGGHPPTPRSDGVRGQLCGRRRREETVGGLATRMGGAIFERAFRSPGPLQ